MTAFFISSTNPEADLQRCDESRKFLSRLVITGATEQGEIKMFPQHGANTNVVLRARDAHKLAQAKRAVEDMLDRVRRAQSNA
jgi:hypothetical protein